MAVRSQAAKSSQASQGSKARASQETRKVNKINKSHDGPTCHWNSGAFCFVCARYVLKSARAKFTEPLKTRYQQLYGVKHLKNAAYPFAGSGLCKTCQSALYKQKQRFRPAVWHTPSSNHHDCFICETSKTPARSIVRKQGPFKREKQVKTFKYREDLSVERPDKASVGERLMDVEDSDTQEPTLDELFEKEQENEADEF